MREVLFNRNFTFLVLGQISSLIGNYTLKFALAMYVLEKTGSATVFATLMAIAMIPTILLSPFGGILADRFPKRDLMVGLDLLSGSGVLLSFLFFQENSSIILIAALQIFLSIMSAFESPVVQACVPQMQSGENLLRGNAIVNQIQAVVGLITPFMGSLFYTVVGIRFVLFVAAVCFFLTALLECFIQLEFVQKIEKQNAVQIIKADFLDSIDFLCRQHSEIFHLLLMAALVSFFVIGLTVVGLPFLVRNVLGFSAQYYGAAESIMGVAAIAGGILTGVFVEKIRVDRLNFFIMILGICLLPVAGIFFVPIHFLGKYFVLVLGFAGGQMVCSMFSIIALSLVQQRTPQHLIGKVMAYVIAVSMCAQPLGQLVYGVLFDLFRDTVWIVLFPTGGIILGIGIFSSRFFQKWKELELEIEGKKNKVELEKRL